MKILFMGTPDFSVSTLKFLVEKKLNVIGVITQPDKPKGRGNKVLMTPVKEAAIAYGIEVYQPKKIKDKEFVEIIKDMNPDLIIVVAFGQLLSKEILDIPKFGCINIHASLLPKYRGAAPINWAIINGEKVTGVTTMFMDEGLDTGDMILKKEIEIKQEDTAGTLFQKLAVLGTQVLDDTLELIKENKLVREKQNDELSSYAPIMDKTLGNINWDKSAREISNLIKGTNPWPSSYTQYKNLKMKIWESRVLDEECVDKAGKIISVNKDGIKVNTKDKILLITQIQMPDKKRMNVGEYIKGNEVETDIILGE